MKGWENVRVDSKGHIVKDNPVIRHKFNAKPTVIDDNWFASKLESRYYEYIKRDDTVLFFLRQVPFHLPENEKYVVDFVAFKKDGTVHFIDIKGMATRDFLRKKALVEKYYPVIIEIVKRGKW